MTNATPALLALLLVLSVPAITIVAAGPADGGNSAAETVRLQTSPSQTPTTVNNTTNRLPLSGEVRSEYTEYGPDLGTALASADDQLRIDHDQYTIVDSEFDDATDEERKAIIQAAYDRLKDRANELEQRERNATRAHAAGERSSAELLRTLLRNHNEAAMLSRDLEELGDRADQVPGYSLSGSQTRATHTTLDAHRTPLRSKLGQLAERPTDNVQYDVVVSTSQTGYSLAMMDGSQYVVETSRFDNRDESAPDRFESGEAYDHIGDLYPWASEFGPSFQDNSPGYYWADVGHDHGRLEFYFDSGTGDVYREIQELSVSSLPTDEDRTWISGGLRLTTTETAAGGPVKVTVVDAETGEPVRATLSVDGTEVGETDDDGTHWIARPLGPSEITAETDAGSVNATIDAAS
ncbi:DUF7096 domain-containing protein [Natrinema altunense]|uniref:Uncharacterized protein n=1 Tax=Natrinema altunense TaxID=222984 RepID=A0A482XXP7_9EURY|nr:hypothetical protein [Natrinema altunense]RZH68461.1 hypothetical protein ELS17_03070 [Natrinema altunense]